MTQNRVKQAKLKAAKYCAFAERSPRQVREKLVKYGLDDSSAEEILLELVGDGFVSESRFADAFVHDKFIFNKWGKMKIRHELHFHDIPENIIQQALLTIPEQEYMDTINKLIREKWDKLSEGEDYLSKKKKIFDYLVRKGFEFQDVLTGFDELMSGRKH